MELNFSKGERLCVTDKSYQIFEGNVKNINKEFGRLILSDIVQQPCKVIEGNRSFDRKDIIEIKKCKVKNSIKSFSEDLNITLNNIEEKLETPEETYNKFKELKKEYKYIEKIDLEFKSAILTLKQSDIVGVIMEDTSNGRAERASVLAVATDLDVFIFDLITLGEEGFHGGLKQFLESQDIVKVVHDCRLMSDCLKYKYLTNLENVRDLEAEDIMIVEQERKMIRKHSRSLCYLIKIYLNVDINDSNILLNNWEVRPLPNNVLDHLAILVSFMIPIQGEIEKKYYQRLIDASNLYSNVIRNSGLYEFVHMDPNCTLRNQIIELVKPKDVSRENYKPTNVSRRKKE